MLRQHSGRLFSHIKTLPSLGKPFSSHHGIYHKAIFASIPTVEEAVAGLKKEEAALIVEIVGGDSKDSQPFALPQQLFLPGVHPVVWGSLEETSRVNWGGGVEMACVN